MIQFALSKMYHFATRALVVNYAAKKLTIQHMGGIVDGFERFSSSLFGVARGWNKLATSVMKEYDLKGVYAFYLFALNEYDGSLTSADLANVCGRDKADVSRAVTTLEARGLLKREGNSSNAPSSSSTILYMYSVACVKISFKGENICIRLNCEVKSFSGFTIIRDCG